MSNKQQSTDLHAENLLSLSRAKTFLGREFLTWLWYQSESGDNLNKIESPVSGETYICDLWIDDKVTLESSQSTVHSHALRGGNPSQSIEAAAALQSGKTVKSIKIGVNIEGFGEYLTTLNSSDLAPRSLTVPEPEEHEEIDANSLLSFRINKINAFLDVLDGLFSQFLSKRVNLDWRNDQKLIKGWIDDKIEPLLH
ncbi:MAG: hypothetical protein CMP10_03750 [Zetaproteobacteria bacterium]|mgnify:CR=1 FL=1|nr:hypothetical protein [Pseudobdellovibrionaceae bacterium]